MHAPANIKYDPYLLDGIPNRMGYLPRRGQYRLHDPVDVYGEQLGYVVTPSRLGQFDWGALLQTGIDYYKQKQQSEAARKAAQAAAAAATARAQAIEAERRLIAEQQAAMPQITEAFPTGAPTIFRTATGGFNWMMLLPLAAIPLVLLLRK